MRLDRQFVARLDDRGSDRIVTAPGAQRRDLALVVAMRVAEAVLGEPRMMKFRLCNVGHEGTESLRLVMAGFIPAIHAWTTCEEGADARDIEREDALRAFAWHDVQQSRTLLHVFTLRSGVSLS